MYMNCRYLYLKKNMLPKYLLAVLL